MKLWISCLVLLALVPGVSLAQTAQGRITGTVNDPDGAVIPGVEVVAINEETGVRTRAQSNEAGLYVLPFLIPGPYTINASAQGFKTYSRKGIVIETSQVLALNIALVPLLGISGAALATTFPYLGNAAASIVLYRRRLSRQTHEVWRLRWDDVQVFVDALRRWPLRTANRDPSSVPRPS